MSAKNQGGLYFTYCTRVLW